MEEKMEEKKVGWMVVAIVVVARIYLFGAPLVLCVALEFHARTGKEALKRLDARISYVLEEDRNHFEISQAGDERISDVEIDRIWDDLDWRDERDACMRMWWEEVHGKAWCEKNLPGWNDDDTPWDEVVAFIEAEEAEDEAFEIAVMWADQMLADQGVCWSDR